MKISLKPIQLFFENLGIKPWPFQLECWQAYVKGKNGLINVPTGSGKTYAAFGGPLAHLIADPKPGIQILYITPLRACANDVEKALSVPLEILKLPFRVEKRTGDTSQAIRKKQKKLPPEILLTTPESLALMLSNEETAQLFTHLKAVIVDEWHELMGSKRGVMLELLLAQLVRLSPPFRLWGMSATLGNREESALVLGGSHHSLETITATASRDVLLETLLPDKLDGLPWSGYFGLKMTPLVIPKLDPHHSTLIFTNTKSQAEKWFESLLKVRPEWSEIAAIHHGSLDLEERHRVEEGIKNGTIRIVVCTSSLDLGVDFSPVSHVFQIGSPKSLTRLLQRAGRSHHRPFEPCNLFIVPTHVLELLELLSLRKGLERKVVETRKPLELCLDVLIQHLMSRACGGGFTQEEVLKDVQSTFAFKQLTETQLDSAIAFLEKGGISLKAYPEFQKLKRDGNRLFIEDRRQKTIHRMNIGTIASDTSLQLKLQRGHYVGNVDESFINRLKKGEVFMFGGKSYEFITLDGLKAVIKVSRKKPDKIVRWVGTKLPLSKEVSEIIREVFGYPQGFQTYSEYPLFLKAMSIQKEVSVLPHHDELLIEVLKSEEGHHLFIYPFESRKIHHTLNALLATRMLRHKETSFSLASNEYGCEIFSPDPLENFLKDFSSFLTEQHLEEDLNEALNLGEMARTTFRDIARIAGLVPQNYPGKSRGLRQIQMTTSLLYDVFVQFEPQHMLLHQAIQEVKTEELEIQRLRFVLKRLQSTKLRIVHIDKLSPFSLPLFIERSSLALSTESLESIVEKIQSSWSQL